ncbi:MAG TPA: hypothetical protein GX736_03630 [Mogibacterium sp.]|nr:hypothetical protein [Mogibacterium sp.]
MVEKENSNLKPRYVVKPGIMTFLCGTLGFLMFLCALIFLILYDGYDLYILGILIGLAYAIFFYWQIIAIRITVYHGYITIRDFEFRTHTYKFGEIYLLDRMTNGFYGPDEAVIVDNEQRRIVTISSYCINFDEFYALMKRKRRVIKELD